MTLKFKNHILALLFLPFTFQANHIRKAYEALSVHDYFKARKLFYKSYYRKPNSVAAYGLANIFARNNNPFYQPDSAIKYAAAAYHLSKNDTATREYCGIKVNKLLIRELIDSLGTRKLNNILNLGKAELFNQFLKEYNVCSYFLLHTALQKRDELCYKAVKEQNQSVATHEFIKTHPYSHLIKEAIQWRDKQIYEEITASKEPASYKSYISMYKTSIHVTKAYRELLSNYKKNKNPDGLYDFIRSYPNAPQIKEAWESLFTISINRFTNEELQNFLGKYPDFPFKNSIIRELQLNKKELIPVSLQSKTGFADTSGKIVIDPVYDDTAEFQEGLCVVQKGDSVFFINKENKIFLNRIFEEALPFHNGIAAAKLGGKWFFMNRMGEAIGDTLDEINPMSNDTYVCRKNNLYGSMNAFAELEVPFQYEKLGDFINKAAYYQKNNMYGFITKAGYVHPAEFNWISGFNKAGQAVFKKGNFFGIINEKGELLLSAEFDQIITAPGDIYLLIKNKQYGFYSTAGCYLSEIRYQYKASEKPEYYTNGNILKLIYKDKISLCDLNGINITEPGQYQEMYLNTNEMIRVVKNNKFGYINHKGQLIIPLKFSEATDFTDSSAIVKTKKQYSLINPAGKVVFISDYEIEQISYNLFITENDNEESIAIDAKGNILPYRIKVTESFGNYQILYLENDSIKILKRP